LYDLLLMIFSENYVPPLYPLAISFFNCFLWAFYGALVGLCMQMYWKKQTTNPQMHHWATAYLIPFFIIYAAVGLVPLPDTSVTSTVTPSPGYLTWISIMWVLLIWGFLFRYYKSNHKNSSVNSFSFCLETILLVGLSNFYFNYELFFKRLIGDMSVLKYILFGVALFGGVIVTGIILKTKKFIVRRDHYFNSTKFYTIVVSTALFLPLVLTTIYVSYYKHYREDSSQTPVSAISGNNNKSNVILIVLDTVNAKSMSLYGGPAQTPNIENLARDSLTFNRCISSSSWTLSSHASLFTGCYPSEHLCNFKTTKLNDKFDTLAEIFFANGYQTAAIVANFGFLHKGFNLNQGFQVYDCVGNVGSVSLLPFHPLLQTFSYVTNIYPKSILAYRVAEDIVDESIHRIETLKGNPFFLFLNLLDAHSPYRPPYPFASTYVDKKVPSFYRLKQIINYFSGSYSKSSWDAYLLSQYYGEIEYLDSKLGKLFDYLKKENLYDSALIVVTSDHGELFGKNGFYEHNNNPMYEGLIKVPLIVKTPFNRMVGTNKAIINLTDVFPTVLHLNNLSIPQDISGETFGGKKSGVAEFISFNLTLSPHRIIYDGDYKAFKFGQRASELYNLKKDPDEKENLFINNKNVFNQAAAKLDVWTSRHQRKFNSGHMRTKPIPDKVKEDLKALGYVN